LFLCWYKSLKKHKYVFNNHYLFIQTGFFLVQSAKYNSFSWFYERV